jgi:hypothetical protein
MPTLGDLGTLSAAAGPNHAKNLSRQMFAQAAHKSVPISGRLPVSGAVFLIRPVSFMPTCMLTGKLIGVRT